MERHEYKGQGKCGAVPDRFACVEARPVLSRLPARPSSRSVAMPLPHLRRSLFPVIMSGNFARQPVPCHPGRCVFRLCARTAYAGHADTSHIVKRWSSCVSGGAPGASDSADPMILVNVMGTVQYGHVEAKPPPVAEMLVKGFAAAILPSLGIKIQLSIRISGDTIARNTVCQGRSSPRGQNLVIKLFSSNLFVLIFSSRYRKTRFILIY